MEPRGLDGVTATVLRNGAEERRADAGEALGDLGAIVDLVSRRLADAGERLKPGDRIISGSITPLVPVEAGDRVAVDLGPLGRVELSMGA